MTTRKELIEQMNSLREQMEAVEQQMKEQTPQPVEQSGLSFSPTPLGHLIVSFQKPGSSHSVPANTETTIKLRDMLLALHPLDPAPDEGWVSVEERVPASPKDVFVWTEGRALLAWHDNTRAVWFERSNERRELSPVTHWRELPAPPASERSKP